MKILVTGTRGQLVQSLVERGEHREGLTIATLGRPDIDLLEPETLLPAIEAAQPDLVVSAAAYTAVDDAEKYPHLAFGINADGIGALGAATAKLGIPIIHVSTDYVFSGEKGAPYHEGDPAGPLGAYGLSKYAGELAVAAANARSHVLRTSWAHSPYGKNFIRTMIELAATRPSLRVVADRFGSPTSMLDVADAILHLAARPGSPKYGLYHLANRGSTNWADLARHAFAASRAVGGPWAEVEDIAASQYPLPAERPESSILLSTRFEETFNWSMPSWQDSATTVAQRIASQVRAAVDA